MRYSCACHGGPPAGTVSWVEFTQALFDGLWIAGGKLSASHRSQPQKICTIGCRSSREREKTQRLITVVADAHESGGGQGIGVGHLSQRGDGLIGMLLRFGSKSVGGSAGGGAGNKENKRAACQYIHRCLQRASNMP